MKLVLNSRLVLYLAFFSPDNLNAQKLQGKLSHGKSCSLCCPVFLNILNIYICKAAENLYGVTLCLWHLFPNDGMAVNVSVITYSCSIPTTLV